MLVDGLIASLQRVTAAWLSQPDARVAGRPETDAAALAPYLLPGDVLLVEGKSRFARIVKAITQSTWSHVAIHVGANRVVEADVQDGVRTLPLSALTGCGIRVMRAVGLSAEQREAVAQAVLARVGQGYDLKHAIRLGRAHLPIGRRDIDPSADPERAICSTLIAHAFASIGHPIFADPKRHWASARPCDFDLSPHFECIETEERTWASWLAPVVGGALMMATHAAAASSVAPEPHKRALALERVLDEGGKPVDAVHELAVRERHE